MKRLIVLAPLALLLAGCSAAPPEPSLDEARATCLVAYEQLPEWLANLESQTGEPADASTACDNWMESQGESKFIAFWTTPSEYLPYVATAAKSSVLG